jgi:hypothetical protein
MPYSLKTYDGTSLVTIADGLVDDQVTTPLFLIGKNVTGYGTRQNENFLYLLENFAGISPPFSARTGQLWFDKTPGATKLNVNDGSVWKGLAVEVVSTSRPTTSSLGDLWFDSNNSQIWVKSGTGTDFTLVGPDAVPGFGVTKLVPKAVKDINSATHVVLDVTINNDVLAIFSQDAFSMGGNESEYTAGFTSIVRGLTLRPGASLSGLDIPSRGNAEVIDRQWNFSNGIKLGSTVTVTTDSNRNLILSAVDSNVIVRSEYLLPATPTASIGSATQPFDEITVSNITSGSPIKPLNVIADTIMFTDSKLRPFLDNNVSLGTSVGRWKKVYSYGLSAGSSSASGTIEGIWSVAQGSRLITPAIETPELTSGGTALPGTVIGQWALYPGSTWQATQLIDSNGNALSPDINANPNTVVLRTNRGQVNATVLNGQVVGALKGDSTGTHYGPVFGDVAGNVRALITTSTNVYSSMVTATNIYGYLTGPVKGDVTGNVTGNITGSVLSTDLRDTLVNATTKQLGYTGAALVGNLSGNVTGNLNSTDGSTVMINASTKQIGYGGANILGKLTGSVYGMVFGYDTTTLLVNGFDNKIGYAGASLAGTLTGNVTGASSVSSINISASGVINASAGNSGTSGIKFPADPGGGSGDLAWIRYYAYSGEQTNLEIGVGNDPIGSSVQDSINLVTSGGVGINRQAPRYALDVTGDIGCSVLHGIADNSVLWNGSNKFISTGPPTNDQGADGDFWFQREA